THGALFVCACTGAGPVARYTSSAAAEHFVKLIAITFLDRGDFRWGTDWRHTSGGTQNRRLRQCRSCCRASAAISVEKARLRSPLSACMGLPRVATPYKQQQEGGIHLDQVIFEHLLD